MTREQVIDRTIDRILEREKGYVDNPADRGGPTNFGITLQTLARWRGRPVSASDVRALTAWEARGIYRSEYIERPGFLVIEDPLLFDLVVDSGVNHGQERAVKWLQDALGVKADGDLGPVTHAALANADTGELYRRFLALRLRFYGRIVSRDHRDADRDGIPDATEMASGWLNRLSEFVLQCPEAAAPGA